MNFISQLRQLTDGQSLAFDLLRVSREWKITFWINVSHCFFLILEKNSAEHYFYSTAASHIQNGLAGSEEYMVSARRALEFCF